MIRPSGRGPLILGVAITALFAVVVAPGAARADRGLEALALIPSSSDAVLAVNVDRLRGSPYYTALVDRLKKSGDFAEGAELLEQRVGFDVDKDLATLVFAGEVEGERDDDFVLFMKGRYDRDRLMKVARDGGDARTHRRVAFVVTEEEVALALVDGFLVVAPTVERMKEVIDVHRRKARAMRRNRAMMRLVQNTDTARDLWMVVEVGPELRKGMSGAPMMREVEAMSASLDLKRGLGLKMRLATATEAAAKTLQAAISQAQKLLAGDPNLGPMLGKLGVNKRAKAVDLSLDLTASELSSLVGTVGAMPL